MGRSFHSWHDGRAPSRATTSTSTSISTSTTQQRGTSYSTREWSENALDQTIMDSFEALQRRGVLYGPNFEDWKARMLSLLRIHQLDGYLEEYHRPSRGGATRDRWTHGSQNAANYISMMVRPELLQRVPTSEKANAALIMKRLEAISTSFRFLDLPAELRNRIYGFYLAECGTVVIKPYEKKTTGYPPITKVSRQTRSEVLPLFYASATFELSYTSKAPPLALHAQQWVSSTVGDKLKQLRCISIRVQMEDDQAYSSGYISIQEVRFTAEGVKGLQVHYPDRMLLKHKRILDEHTRVTRNTSSAMGLGNDGGALLLAVLTLEAILKTTRFHLQHGEGI